MRPPRRLVKVLARVGSSAITARRVSIDMRDHAPISSMDRKQPTHSLASG